MPNRKKLYNALKQEGYDNFADEKEFNAYVENPDNRRTLFNALKEEGYDNFADEKEFDDYLGYSAVVQKPSPIEPSSEFALTGNGYDPATGTYHGGVGTKQEADSIFEANAKAAREKYAKKGKKEERPEQTSVWEPEYHDWRTDKQKQLDAFTQNNQATVVRDREGNEYYPMKPMEVAYDEAVKEVRKVTPLDVQLDERIKANKEALKKAYEKKERPEWGKFGIGGVGIGRAYSSSLLSANESDEIKDLKAEQEYLRNAKTVLNAARNDAGFFQGMKDAVQKASFMDFGVSDMNNAQRINAIQQKVESGQPLTDSEQSLLSSLGLQQTIEQQYNDMLGSWYKAGMTTADMAPFMLEMAANPASGLGKAAMKAVVKKLGEKGAKAVAMKVISRTLGDVAGAAAMTATTGAAGTTADALERQRGDVLTRVDENGNIVGYGFKEGDDAGDAWRKAFTSRTIENWSEMVGQYFDPIGKVIGKGARKGLEKIKLSSINDFIDNVNSSNWAKTLDDFTKKTQWNGSLGEFGEEQVGMVADALLVGDTQWSDLVDAEKQLDTALGVGVFGTAMSLLRMGGYRTPKARARKAYQRADKNGLERFGEQWELIKGSIDESTSDEETTRFLAQVFASDTTDEQKKAAFEYVNALKAQQAVNTVKETQKIDEPENPEVQTEAAYEEGAEQSESPEYVFTTARAQRKAAEALKNADETAFGTLEQYIESGQNPEDLFGGMDAQTEELARDYYNKVMKMRGVMDSVKDRAQETIEAEHKVIDSVTNPQTGMYGEVDLRGYEGDKEIRIPAYVIDEKTVDGKRVLLVQREGEQEREWIQPGLYYEDSVSYEPAEDVKRIVSEVLMADADKEVADRSRWNPNIPEPQAGVSFDYNGENVTIIGDDGNGGLLVAPTEEYQKAQGNEKKMSELVMQAGTLGGIPVDAYKDAMTAQMEAEETKQAFVDGMARKVMPDGRILIPTGINGEEVAYDLTDAQGNLMESGVMDSGKYSALADYVAPEDVALNDDGTLAGEAAAGEAAGEAAMESQPTGTVAEDGAVANEDVAMESQPTETAAERKPMSEEEAKDFVTRMEQHSEPIPEIEFTPENWLNAFGESGTIETPIGTVKMGENQISKLFLKKRTKEFGMIAPTLSNPDVIVEETSSAKDGKSERESTYLFIKTFNKDGQKVRYYTSVTVLQDGMEVSVSSHVLGEKQVPKKLTGGNVIYIKDALSSNSSDGHLAEQPNAVPDLLPTQENNASLSENKVSEEIVESQEKKKDFVDLGVENAIGALGEKYGEKMPRKVENTRKAFAADLKKAEAALAKAQDAYDDAPIGREEKAEKALQKAQQEYEAVKREADFWAELDDEIKAAQVKPGEAVSEEILSMEEPMNGEEFAAQMLANGNIKLLQGSFTEETGFGKEEAKKYFGLFASADKGGMSVSEAGERLMESDRENGTNFFDQNDPNAGRNAIIEVLSMAQTRGDLAKFIKNNRAEQARKEQEAEYAAYEAWVEENFHMSVADYETYEEVIARDLAERGLTESEFQEFMSTFVDETLNSVEDGQQRIDSESERSSEVLHGTQSVPTGRTPGIAEESSEADGGVVGEDGAVLEGASGSEVKPIGFGVFGNIYNQFKGKAKEAFEFLMKHKSGDLLGVFYKEGLGDIDFVWGDEKKGFKHIIDEHVYVIDPDFKSEQEAAERIEDIITNGEITKNREGKATIEKDGYRVIVSKNINGEKKNWVLTAYDSTNGKGKIKEKTTPNVTPITPNIANESRAVAPGVASSSTDKGSNLSEENKGNEENVSEQIEKARAEVEQNPTEAQKEAGNYKKGHVKIDGFDISIENPKGGVRSGVDKNGKKWSITMNNDYGYIRGTEAVDGDHIDVFLSDNPTEGRVFVVDQTSEDGSFDESKVMYGFNSLEEARAAYLSNYEKGWENRIMAITEVSKDEFKKWIDSSHRKTKAFSEYKGVRVEEEKPYTIESATYTTKKGKVLDMFLVKPVKDEMSREKQTTARILAKNMHGWYDKNTGGWMLRSKEDVQEFADEVFAVSHSDSYDLITMKNVTDGDISFSEPKQEDEYSPVWQYVTHVDKETGFTTLRREDISGVVPIGDARFTIQATSPQEMLDILRNPLNGLEQALDAVGVTLENKVKTRSVDKKVKEAQKNNPSGNKLVSDERYAELRERMRKKLGGQMNMGIDPEILAIGTEMAVYHIEKGARKFAEYAKAMIADLGDAIRPYLKAFYNGARDLPEVTETGWADEMTPYEEVSAFDVTNFDQPSVDVMKAAETIVKEQEVKQQAEVAKERVKKQRNPKKKTKETVSLSGDLFNQNVETNEESTSRQSGRPGTAGNQTADVVVGSETREEGRGTSLRGEAGSVSGHHVSDENRSGRVHGVSEQQPSVKQNARNFSFGEGHIEVPSGDIAKLKANIEAIRTLKEIEASGQPATDAQKKILSKYVGWGGLSAALDAEKARFQYDRSWNEKYLPYYKQLQEILTKEEFNDAVQSTNTSHYTPEEVIRGMWKMVEQLGFKGGRINEPAAGVGHILGLMPQSISERSIISGTELDSLSGRIAKALYPDAAIKVQGYETEFAPKSKDLVITNVPFGKTAPYDKALDKALRKKMGSAYNLHNYFIAKGLLELKEGGIGVFVTSSATMDGANSKFREWVAANGIDLIGAVRLPNDAFLKNAGTSVTADMLVFRKRKAGETSNGVNFVSTTQVGEGTYQEAGEKRTKPIMVNEYFAEHPDMMLGEMKTAHDAGSGGLYSGASQTCVAKKGANLADELNNAIGRLGSTGVDLSESQDAAETSGKVRTTDLKNGTLVVDGLYVFVAMNGELQPVEAKVGFTYNGKSQKTADAVRDYNALKETLKSLIQAEQSTTENPEPLRKKLNQQYDAFVAKYGTLNRNKYLDDVLAEDFEHNLPLSLESVKRVPSATGKSMVWEVKKGEGILSKRVSYPVEEPTKAENVEDAIHISRSYRGLIDIPYVASLTGKTEEEVTDEMLQEGLAYRDPLTGDLVDKESYLSGNVKEKLEQARAMAEEHPEYQKNVEDLMEVQPETVRFGDISYRIGTPWIPTQYVNDFALEVLGIRNAEVNYVPSLNEFVIGKYARVDDFAKAGQFRTDRVGVADLLEYALNQRKPKIVDKKTAYGPMGKTEERVPNEAETQAAAEKIMEISDKFIEYIDGRNEIHRELERIYNDKYNNYRLKQYELPSFSKMEKNKDGKDELVTHYPNSNREISMREHQAKAIQRCLSESTLLAHQVGTGKTFTMITTAMEMRRLGIAKKPMIVVQNATLEDFVKDFYKLYPGANVLAPGKDERSAENRKRLFNLIATGDFDAIVIPQSFMQFIPDDEGRKKELIQKRIDEYEQAIANIEDYSLQRRMQKEIDALRNSLEGGKEKKRSVKDKAKAADRIKSKMERQLDRRTDDVLTFEQMGVDALFIDEAHNFKKIGFASKMSNVKGIDTSASQRANSLLLKAQYVQEKNGGRNVILATGTPITNTMAEVWTMMKFVSPDILEDYNIKSFDDFATTFGTVEPSLEFTATGNFKIADRFKSYVNVPELVKAFRSHADVVLTSDVKEFKENNKIPKMKNDQMTNVVIEKNEDLEDVMDVLIKKLEAYNNMSGSEKREWSALPLVVFSRAKQAAIDLRLLNPKYEDNPNSKTNHVVRNVLQLYKESTAEKGTQLVFCDSYQSPGEAPKMDLFDFDPDVPRFNLYEDIKKKLVEGGIPANEIAIVNNYDGERRKQLFEKVRNGDVRVLLGSTEKMGVGVNVQDRLYALHHIDAPIRPMDFEQRNGRILRQGNLYAEWGKPVNVVTYGVQGTLDATAYDRLRIKQDFINQMMKGDVSGRVMEEQDEEDPSGMTFNQMAATLSGDKTAQLLFVAENDLKKLRNLKRSDFNSKSGMGESIQIEERKLVGLNDKLELWGKAKETVKKYFPEGVKDVKVNGQTFTEKLGVSLDPVIENYEEAYSLNRGTAPLKLSLNNGSAEVIVHFDEGRMVYELYAGKEHVVESRQFNGGKGLMSSIEHQLKSTEKNYEETKQKIAESKKKIQGLEKAMKAPWGREEELKKKEQKVADLKKQMEEKAAQNTKGKPVNESDDTLYRNVYHGSGAEFDKFDHSYMGSGEGAQSYGWGTYVTDVEGIGKQYAGLYAKNSPLAANALHWMEENGTYDDFLAQGEGKRRNWAIRHAKDYLKEMKEDGASEEVIKSYEQDLKDAEDAISEDAYNRIKENMIASLHRNLYKVEIPDNDGTNYIEWDKPLTEEQAKRIKDAVLDSRMFKDYAEKYGEEIANKRLDGFMKAFDAGRVYRLLENFADVEDGMDSSKTVSKVLSDAGFVGFEYPANFMNGGREDGAKNFVIFDEKDLKIKEHTRFRTGEGTLTADEVSMANDPIGKVLGQPSRTASERKSFAERERKRMVERVESLAKKLHLDNVEIVTDASTLSGAKSKAKGFYSRSKRKITIVIPNHSSVFDAEQTLLHEAVAHYGLRELFGAQFDVFLNNVYRNASREVRDRINQMAMRNGWDFPTATEEYLASLAENTDFEKVDRSWWEKIKDYFLKMLHSIGFEGFTGVTLTDNELRYILWRSYENLAEPGKYRSIFGEAADVVMQNQLKVGNYASVDASTAVVAESSEPASAADAVIAEFEEKVANHPAMYAVRTEADIDALPVRDSLKNSLKEKMKNPRSSGINLIGKDMMILFVNHKDESEIRRTIHHELAHFASRNLNLDEFYKMAVLDYLRRKYPDEYKHITRDYAKEDWGEEAVAYLFEKKSEEIGFERLLNSTFDTHKDIGYVFTNIVNYLNHGRQGTEYHPLRHRERPSSREHSGGNRSVEESAGSLAHGGSLGGRRIENSREEVVDEGDVLYRTDVSGKLNIRDEYDSLIKKSSYQSREALQDSMLSLRRVQEMIEKASGSKLREFENAYMHENRLSSVVQAEMHEMEREVYKPMMESVKKLMKAAGLTEHQVSDYLMLKHQIERNREMAVRKALTNDDGSFDRDLLQMWYDEKQTIRNDASLPTWREKQEAMDEAALRYGVDTSVDYSGLTSMFDTDDIEECTRRAYNEVEGLEQSHPSETGELNQRVKAMTQNTLDKSFESGLLDKSVYDELTNDMYDYYIPLRGFEETTSDEVYAYMDGERGAFNAPLRRAHGRTSKSDNPLAYMKSIADSGIMQGNRNKMKQTFLNMVLNHPTDLVSVKEGVWAVYNPATGEWEASTMPDSKIPKNASPADVEAIINQWEEDMERQAATNPNIKKIKEADDVPFRVTGNRINQHQVVVKRMGKTYTLTVNGNPRLAMALNGQTNPNNTQNDGKVMAYTVKKIDAINRSLSAWYTTRNVDFVASNFMRDTFYTNTIVRAKEGNAYANSFHKHYAELLMPGRMIGLFNKYENGTLDPSKPMEKHFLDFMMNGGETGYSNLKDLEQIKNQIAKELKGDRLAQVKAVLEKLDAVNRAVENTSRFAAYLTSRENGRSIARSVYDAKEISVNFNKKGAGGTFFGATGQTKLGSLAAAIGATGRSFYVFFNAAIQGTTNLMHVMKINPKGTSLGMAAMFLMGAVIPYLLGGDDEKEYYDLPEHVRRNHLVLPGIGKAWISIPLPIEYRIMYGMGELLTSWRTGHERGNIGMKMLALAGQALPLNFMEEGLNAFIPSALSPFWQSFTNESWTGLPIYKDNEFNKDDPEYTKAYSGTNKNLVAITKALYEWTFDEESQEARIDLNPAIIETIAEGYFSGATKTLDNLSKVVGMVQGEREFDWRYIPIANRVIKTGDERTKAKRITNEYFENMEKLDFLQARERRLKKVMKGAAVPDEDKAEAKEDYDKMINSEVYKKYKNFKAKKKRVDGIRKSINAYGLTKEREKQLSDAQEEANEQIR